MTPEVEAEASQPANHPSICSRIIANKNSPEIITAINDGDVNDDDDDDDDTRSVPGPHLRPATILKDHSSLRHARPANVLQLCSEAEKKETQLTGVSARTGSGNSTWTESWKEVC